MSQNERFDVRDQSYSAWHRRNSIRRFIGIERAQSLAMIDLDAVPYVEYDEAGKMPLFFIETAIDCGQSFKVATVTKNCAMLADIPAYTVLYKLSDQPNPAAPDHQDIEQFRYQRIWPKPENADKWHVATPKEFAEFLVKLRERAAQLLDPTPV